MTLDEKIAAADAALHKLLTGSLREEVEYQGRRVRFGKADISKLSAYLAELKAEKSATATRGAIGIVF